MVWRSADQKVGVPNLGNYAYIHPELQIYQTSKSAICENVSVNSTALIDHTSHDTGKEPELIGDRTECALLLMT